MRQKVRGILYRCSRGRRSLQLYGVLSREDRHYKVRAIYESPLLSARNKEFEERLKALEKGLGSRDQGP